MTLIITHILIRESFDVRNRERVCLLMVSLKLPFSYCENGCWHKINQVCKSSHKNSNFGQS